MTDAKMIGRPKSDRVCDIGGCTKTHYGKGFCQGHYWRWKRSGHPLGGNVRYDAANLAAHNWDVFKIGDQLLVSSAFSGGHWWDKAGNKETLLDEDYAALYPVTDKRYGLGGTTGIDKKQRLVCVDHEALIRLTERSFR